ncbi:hypothetical protein [Lachnoclostridium phytofermentans]|uniref:Uncharacterized protein n=1 Tax=Lachnoclostridium phytofermentans (strain ATCC 700394 / DSM 18823 / ISDg) TaxID=357809 RepID=A9KSL0_LACP7|nr:hypothetical protein [Lachnoclostridium phytofermentans]ABX43662.1 hypothetical protein Cphy_3308 [Lachnoclostridium phytofermentans ISDg]
MSDPLCCPQDPNRMSINRALIEDVDFRGNQGRVTVSYDVTQPNQIILRELLVLLVDERTIILDSSGRRIRMRDLQPGMLVNAIVSPIFTRSNPPQTTAFQITVVREIRNPTRIENILQVNVRNQTILTGNSRNPASQIRFVVNNNTEIFGPRGNRISLSQLRPGQTVRITHENFMTASIPPQTVAIRIQVLL